MSFVVVAYDIRENRRRSRLHRSLKAHLPRTQKSIFEGPAEDRDLAAIRVTVGKAIDPETDTVRLYHLCARCFGRTELFGTAELVAEEAEDVVIDG